MEAQAPLWSRLLPKGDPKRALGLVFIVTVALIWVVASFVVQGIQAQGAHPAVLTLVANSLFAVYVPVYFLNLRLKRRRQASRAAQELETSALVQAGQPRSDEGDDGSVLPLPPPPAAAEDSHNGKTPAPPPMPLKQLFRAALVVSTRHEALHCTTPWQLARAVPGLLFPQASKPHPALFPPSHSTPTIRL